MNNYFKQIWFELRHQPVVTLTSVMGTAFAIFFVMAVYMISSVDTVEVAPESNRSRILHALYGHVKVKDGDSSGGLSYNLIKKFYEGVDGIDIISYARAWDEPADVAVKDGDCISLTQKKVDENFWKVFDFKFLSGKPFDKAAVDAGLRQVIIQKSAAEKLFGNADVVGKEVKLNYIPYTIVGVVDNTSSILDASYANIYTPYSPEAEGELWGEGYLGQSRGYLLMSDGASEEKIRQQVKQRYDIMNASVKKDGLEFLYHQQPFNAEMIAHANGSNNDPDAETPRKKRYAIYLVLILLPAINLSSMTRSRLRQRVSEIGVRRAYGATKWNILNRFLGENLVLTLSGGMIGLMLCIIFVAFFSSSFTSFGDWWSDGDITTARPTFDMLINLKTFGWALLICLILNLVSTGLPAWKASRTNPAEAISGKND